MNKSDLTHWLQSKGYHRDKFGHYQKESGGKTYRYKLSSTAARYEFRADIGGHNEWLRIASGYFKDLSITSDGRLAGLKR